MADEWHFTSGGEQSGPVTWTELKRLADEKKLAATDLVWNESMDEWIQAGKLDGLIPSSPVVRKPPPLPGSVAKAPVSTPAVDNRVTGELCLAATGGVHRGTMSGVKEKIAVLLDQERIGTGTLVDGFTLRFESVVGRHSVTLKEEREATGIAKFMMAAMPAKGLNKSYPVTFDKPGHYSITFIPPSGIKAKLGLEILPGSIDIEYTPQASGLIAVSEERRNALCGLWRTVVGSGVAFLFTHDQAMLREDGIATKFRWSSQDKIELYMDGCEPTANFQILSLGVHELILPTSHGTEHFVRGKTVTEEEVQRRQAEARQQQAEAAVNFKNTATGVAALLSSGGFALLCGGVGLGAAAAGDGIGAGAMSGGGGSSNSGSQDFREKRCDYCNGTGWRGNNNQERCTGCGGHGVKRIRA